MQIVSIFLQNRHSIYLYQMVETAKRLGRTHLRFLSMIVTGVVHVFDHFEQKRPIQFSCRSLSGIQTCVRSCSTQSHVLFWHQCTYLEVVSGRINLGKLVSLTTVSIFGSTLVHTFQHLSHVGVSLAFF